MEEKRRKHLMCFLMLTFFVLIFIFNIFTPLLSDDFDYMLQARSGDSLWDLILQEYNQYMTWNGRSVTFILFRIFLCAPEIVLKLANSIVFMILSVLIYFNIKGRKKYDVLVYLLVQLGLWLFAVNFSQTILWECGAFVYLWGMTIILGFLTTVRYMVESKKNAKIISCILIFLFGWAAGWCNENTSGGALLLLIISAILYRFIYEDKKVPKILITAILGNIVGLGFLVLGPGVRNRASLIEERHSGLYGMVSRIQKLTLLNEEAFLVLLGIFAATIIWSVYYHNRKGESVKQILFALRYRIIFFVVYLATVYALAATAVPQIRALFGAGIFLLIACIQGIVDNLRVDNDGKEDATKQMLSFLYGSVIAAMSIYLFFQIVDCGAMLIRIRRDYDERIAYIEQQIEAGETDIVVAQFHEDFDNAYTCAYEMELTDDPEYWTNVQYKNFFGVNSITAIPYEEWEENYSN